jgi:hypothetical protein
LGGDKRERAAAPISRGSALIAMMQTADLGEGNNIACRGKLHATRPWAVLVEREMRSGVMMQLDNITPTGPRNGKFFIRGIRGLGSAFSCTMYLSGETVGYFGALRRRRWQTAAFQSQNGCSTGRHAAAWRTPTRHG